VNNNDNFLKVGLYECKTMPSKHSVMVSGLEISGPNHIQF